MQCMLYLSTGMVLYVPVVYDRLNLTTMLHSATEQLFKINLVTRYLDYIFKEVKDT
jgi:hypothetical protein